MNKRSQRTFPKSQWIDVETRVAKKDRCCGCGVCAAMCPTGAIRMKFNANKEYRPFVDHDICINCGLCLCVCPDNTKTSIKVNKLFMETHPDLEKDKFLGPTLCCYVGYVSNEQDRLASASGGVLTAVLEELFESDEIDAVVLAGESNYRSTGRFFEAKLVTNIEGIRANRGSKYYPIAYSEVLKIIKSDDRRYAVVGIPCVTIAIRKAQLYNSHLRRNIRYILTPVCGHNVSALYTEYILRTNGIDPASVIRLTYRDKEGIPVANDYNLAVEYMNARGEIKIKRLGFHRSNVGKTWYTYMFGINKCLYCADFAGELSDASFADAWLDKYVKDVRGTSLIVVRNAKINGILQRMAKGGKVRLSPVSKDVVIAAHKKRFYQKKELIKGRIRWQKMFHKDFPDYGIRWSNVRLWQGLPENLQIWLHLHLSKWLYRHGVLVKLGTDRFLNLVDTPVRLAVSAITFIRGLFKCKR